MERPERGDIGAKYRPQTMGIPAARDGVFGAANGLQASTAHAFRGRLAFRSARGP